MIIKDFLRVDRVKKNKMQTVYALFIGLEDSYTLKLLIEKKSERIKFLKEEKIKFCTRCTCPNVLDPKRIIFPYCYLREDPEHFYLDILHELTHCIQRKKEGINFRKQIMQFEYYENPKEIEAYGLGWLQAKKIGVSKKEFVRYLNENNFLSKKENDLLIKNVFKFKMPR